MSLSLRVLTWNIANEGQFASAFAPTNWTRAEKVSEMIKVISAHMPDLLAIQEASHQDCPSSFTDSSKIEEPVSKVRRVEHTWLGPALSQLSPGYDFHGSQTSHCGQTHLYIKRQLKSFHNIQRVDCALSGVVLCSLDIQNEAAALSKSTNDDSSITDTLYCAACHLEPFKGGAEKRLAALQLLTSCLPSEAPLLIFGDMNMRDAESAAVEQLGLADAWQALGSDKNTRWTFDVYRNMWHGPDSFKFQCRFDRVFYRGLVPKKMQIIGNESVKGNSRWFISDHFGLVTDFELAHNDHK